MHPLDGLRALLEKVTTVYECDTLLLAVLSKYDLSWPVMVREPAAALVYSRQPFPSSGVYRSATVSNGLQSSFANRVDFAW